MAMAMAADAKAGGDAEDPDTADGVTDGRPWFLATAGFGAPWATVGPALEAWLRPSSAGSPGEARCCWACCPAAPAVGAWVGRLVGGKRLDDACRALKALRRAARRQGQERRTRGGSNFLGGTTPSAVSCAESCACDPREAYGALVREAQGHVAEAVGAGASLADVDY
jgi:hypothetical protein